MRYAHLENNVAADALSTLTIQLPLSDGYKDYQDAERKEKIALNCLLAEHLCRSISNPGSAKDK